MDFFWDPIKCSVYETPVLSVEDLIARISIAVERIRDMPGIFQDVRNSLHHPCQATYGHNFKHLLLMEFEKAKPFVTRNTAPKSKNRRQRSELSKGKEKDKIGSGGTFFSPPAKVVVHRSDVFRTNNQQIKAAIRSLTYHSTSIRFSSAEAPHSIRVPKNSNQGSSKKGMWGRDARSIRFHPPRFRIGLPTPH
ncbi:hypothetical protein TNCV_2974921 [Trichonephila clavipes]|nr:hypothetical protein TNCV_2974921 [Trichonephila clavipes]